MVMGVIHHLMFMKVLPSSTFLNGIKNVLLKTDLQVTHNTCYNYIEKR